MANFWQEWIFWGNCNTLHWILNKLKWEGWGVGGPSAISLLTVVYCFARCGVLLLLGVVYCKIHHCKRSELLWIITIPRPEGARDCKIHHEWVKMDITSGDESAQRATSDVHFYPRVVYFYNLKPMRGGGLIIHNFTKSLLPLKINNLLVRMIFLGKL